MAFLPPYKATIIQDLALLLCHVPSTTAHTIHCLLSLMATTIVVIPLLIPFFSHWDHSILDGFVTALNEKCHSFRSKGGVDPRLLRDGLLLQWMGCFLYMSLTLTSDSKGSSQTHKRETLMHSSDPLVATSNLVPNPPGALPQPLPA